MHFSFILARSCQVLSVTVSVFKKTDGRNHYCSHLTDEGAEPQVNCGRKQTHKVERRNLKPGSLALKPALSGPRDTELRCQSSRLPFGALSTGWGWPQSPGAAQRSSLDASLALLRLFQPGLRLPGLTLTLSFSGAAWGISVRASCLHGHQLPTPRPWHRPLGQPGTCLQASLGESHLTYLRQGVPEVRHFLSTGMIFVISANHPKHYLFNILI